MSTNFDLANELVCFPTLYEQITEDGETAGVGIDTAKYLSGVLFAQCESINTASSNAVTIQHSDDGITFEDIPSENLIGDNVIVDVDTYNASPIQKQGFFGQKRYIKANIVTTGFDSEASTTQIDLFFVLKTSTTTPP